MWLRPESQLYMSRKLFNNPHSSDFQCSMDFSKEREKLPHGITTLTEMWCFQEANGRLNNPRKGDIFFSSFLIDSQWRCSESHEVFSLFAGEKKWWETLLKPGKFKGRKGKVSFFLFFLAFSFIIFPFFYSFSHIFLSCPFSFSLA